MLASLGKTLTSHAAAGWYSGAVVNAAVVGVLYVWPLGSWSPQPTLPGHTLVVAFKESVDELDRLEDRVEIVLADTKVVVMPEEAHIAQYTYRKVPHNLNPPSGEVLRVLEELAEKLLVEPPEKVTSEPVPAAVTTSAEQLREITTRVATAFTRPSVAAPPPQNLGTDDTQPDLSNNPPPIYPAQAVGRGWEGRVMLRITIAPNGSVTNVEVQESSGHPILDAAAVNAVRKWTGIPRTRGGRRIESVELLPIRFRLQ